MPAPSRCLKVHVLTWNMHDSLPKGDLEVLLGKVPLYTPTVCDTLPQLSADGNHPYHLIAVAGQECPSVSRMPMGLGAGFKLVEKEDFDRKSSKHNSKEKDSESVRAKKNHEESPHEGPTSGWTFMVEDWLCNGGALVTRANAAVSPSSSEISMPKPLSARNLSKEPKKGPYQLLIKERLMGIYLAIFIHRDIRHLVRAMSKSSVTAGLIGGRVGNKGGVGISLDIDGTTLLFLNCHLAAHEGKVNHRLANLQKIKSELDVADFLKPEDPRMVAEDITDRFDFAFIFGDLNFRLNISRLHADWLISREDYTQAFSFDQLKDLMIKGQEFVGFKEAPIDFPPTFKYDVLRTLKRPRRPSSRLDRWKSQGHGDSQQRITEVHETDHPDGEDDDSEDDGKAESVASSVWTSMHSRPPTDPDGDDGYFETPLQHSASTRGSRVSLSAAAIKAKTKWLAIFSPTSPSSPAQWLKPKEKPKMTRIQKRHSSVDVVTERKSPRRAASLEALKNPFLQPPPPMMERGPSTKSSVLTDEEPTGEDDKGVYDSSAKKRTPAWCDRILWKSTVTPEVEEDEFQTRPKTRMLQFLASALRPLAGRRRASASSIPSLSSTSQADESPPTSPPPESSNVPFFSPFTRFVPTPRSGHSPLQEVLPLSPTQPSSAVEHDAARQRSASLSSSVESTPSERPPVSRSARRATTPVLPSTLPPEASPIGTPTRAPGRWRFLPSFLSHTTTSSGGTLPDPPTRRGDVVCLSYGTLDDRGMRRLEGRSDHRPVIGTFAVYR